MLIPSEVSSALLEASIILRPIGPDRVEISSAGEDRSPVTFRVLRRRGPLSPSQVHRLSAAPAPATLLIVPAASDQALAAAEAVGWSVIATNEAGTSGPTGIVRLPGGLIVLGQRPPADDGRGLPSLRPGRSAWGTFNVVRQLLEGGARTQADLAERAGVSQPRVSQSLRQLALDGLAVGSAGGWGAADWDALLQWWLRVYPGPGGITTYWYGLSSPREQALAVVDLLRTDRSRVAVSGDVAADELAPWRRPALAVVYFSPAGDVERPVDDLSSAGLTPSGADTATLELTVPADPGVWAVGSGLGIDSSLPLADVVQVLWDVHRSRGFDVDQSFSVLSRLIHEQAAHRRLPADDPA